MSHDDLIEQEAMRQRFEAFDRDHPEVYELFRRFALEARFAGHEHFSADAICHRIRWETSVVTRGEAFKINNNYTAFFARKLMAEDRRFAEFFRVRWSVADIVSAAA